MMTLETTELRAVMTVTPTVGLVDERLQIAVQGLPSGETVTIQAHMRDVRDVSWRSSATSCVDPGGMVRLDADDLIASLTPADDPPGRPFDESSLAPLDIEFVMQVTAGKTIRAEALRQYVGDGVQATTLKEHGLYGIFFRPRVERRQPGVIVLGGSSGKLSFASQTAALLASHGLPSFALGYFGLDGLPACITGIRLEYFKTAMEWLSAQDGVRSDAVALLGRSRGAELALLLASRFSNVRSVVAYCPSSVVWNGLNGERLADVSAWEESGRPLPFLSLTAPQLSGLRLSTFRSSPIELTPLFDAALDGVVRPDTIIPVERINGPILLISGDDDRMWPSARMGDQIVRRLIERGHRFTSRHLHYPQAGHLLRAPGVPTSVLQGMFALGGSALAQAAANRGAWTEMLAFLDTSFGGAR